VIRKNAIKVPRRIRPGTPPEQLAAYIEHHNRRLAAENSGWRLGVSAYGCLCLLGVELEHKKTSKMKGKEKNHEGKIIQK
jgi:hypothetical protein